MDWAHRSRMDNLSVRSPFPRRHSSLTAQSQSLYDPKACVPPHEQSPHKTYQTSWASYNGEIPTAIPPGIFANRRRVDQIGSVKYNIGIILIFLVISKWSGCWGTTAGPA